MGEASSRIDVAVPPALIALFLRERALDSRFLDACKEMRGLVPIHQLREEIPGRKLVFHEAARDPLTGATTTGWERSYFIQEVAPYRTRVTMNCSWSMGLGLLGMGTLEAQAKNAMEGDLHALLGLELGLRSARAYAT